VPKSAIRVRGIDALEAGSFDMGFRRVARPAMAGALLLLATVAGVHAQADHAALSALRGIERGMWQLKGSDGSAVRLCLGNPATLLQLRHRNTTCSRFVVENSPTVATIHYSCPGHGHGRTTVSVETPRLVRVDTQGVVDGAPFAAELEGRRLGTCG
jgi:hypothetical protein